MSLLNLNFHSFANVILSNSSKKGVDGNTITYETSYDYGYGYTYTCKWTLTFENDLCVKSICKCTFNQSQLADAFYQGMLQDGTYPVSKSGNSVTIDYTSLHQGLNKDDIIAAISSMGAL